MYPKLVQMCETFFLRFLGFPDGMQPVLSILSPLLAHLGGSGPLKRPFLVIRVDLANLRPKWAEKCAVYPSGWAVAVQTDPLIIVEPHELTRWGP